MSSKKTDLCICKLCTCGRHHCPHQPIRQAPTGPCVFSEYTNEYKEHVLPQITNYKPLAVYKRAGAPLEDRTNHKIDYVPHPLQDRYIHRSDAYVPPEGDFEKNSSYTTDYIARKGERVQMFKREEAKREIAKFEGTPTYQIDYKQWPVSPREIPGKGSQWIPPTESFGGVPTYVSDYIKYNNVKPTDSFRPVQQAESNNIPFDGLTNYKQSYTTHPLEKRFDKERVEWSAPSVPFMGNSTTHADYIEKELSMNQSYKPLSTAKLSTAPLQNETTHNTDYKPWGIGNKPLMHTHEPYKPPEGDMMTDTTYIRDFIPRRTSRVEAFKPKIDRGEIGNFQGNTSYSDDYKRWGVNARKLYGPQRQYIPPDEPFETNTTHSLNYVRKPLGDRVSYKKGGETHTNNAPFDGRTIYHSDYHRHKQDICPALLLNSPRTGYELTGQTTDQGHILLSAIQKEEQTQQPCHETSDKQMPMVEVA